MHSVTSCQVLFVKGTRGTLQELWQGEVTDFWWCCVTHSITPHTQLSFLPVVQGILWSHLQHWLSWFVSSHVASNLLQFKKSNFAQCCPCRLSLLCWTPCAHSQGCPVPPLPFPGLCLLYVINSWIWFLLEAVPHCPPANNHILPQHSTHMGTFISSKCLILDTNSFSCCKERGF